jgi:hypothetical protein
MRRLAVVSGLGHDEAFLSFVDRTALESQVNRRTVLESFGLSANRTELPAGLAIDLTDDGFLTVSEATGLSRERIERSLVRRFGSTGIDLTDLDVQSNVSTRIWGIRSWAFGKKSTCCPKCVAASGFWKVQWRTAWQFLCPHHKRFVVSGCPRCGTALYSHHSLADQVEECCGPPTTVPVHRADGRPRVRRSTANRCGMPMRGIASVAVRDPTLVNAQQRLLALLDAPEAERAAAHATFSSLRSSMVLAWYLGSPSLLAGADPAVQARFAAHCNQRDDQSPRKGVEGPKYRAFSVTPVDPLLVAAAVKISHDMVFGEAPAEAVERFVAATHSNQAERKRWSQLDKFWTPPPRLKPLLDRARAA